MMVPMLHDLPEVRAPVCKWRMLPTVGFRAYCAEDLGLPIPWTWWSGNESPRCNAHKHPPVVRCHCGFHVADDPWHVARTYPEYHGVLVVAPFGKVVMHRYGARAQHYDVVAYVTTPENVTIEDRRVVRARNVPLRAWEVARELAAAASAGLR